MKKAMSILLAMGMTMGLAACGSGSAASTSAASSDTAETTAASADASAAETSAAASDTAKSAADVKIVLLLPGEINDQGWNASNYAGVVACNEQLGTNMEYVEAVNEADFESTFREYAERGYDIIMAAGSQFDVAAKTVAESYPDTLFMNVNGSDYSLDNLCPLFPKEYEASYLAAVIAGNITESGKFGLIGGDPNQAMQDLMNVYGKTAVSIAKERGFDDASYNLQYSNSWDDVALGKQMAENMIDDGADVMFSYANSLSLGVIDGADSKGAKVVGYSADQNDVAPGTVVASINFDYATMYVWAINEWLNGNLKGGQQVEVGVAEDIYFPVYSDDCPEDAKTACDQAVADLKAGSVDLKSLF